MMDSKQQKSANDDQQHKQIVPIELSNLYDMTDDCLLRIFSAKALDLIDLCSVAETCTRFQRITRMPRLAPKKLIISYTEHVEPNDNVYKYSSYNSLATINVELMVSQDDVERIFKNFGATLSELRISKVLGSLISSRRRRLNAFSILSCITRYCGDAEDLTCLTIESYHDLLAVEVKPIFDRLHTLSLIEVVFFGDASLFRGLNSLVELRLETMTNRDAILANIFPKLQRFEYKSAEDGLRNTPMDSLTAFISRHNTLQTLSLFFGCDDFAKVAVLKAIGDSCKELKELWIYMDEWKGVASIQPLQTLQSLRTLTLLEMSFENFKCFAALVQLRELTLSGSEVPNDPNEFGHLAQLTKFELIKCRCMAVIDVPGIIDRLKNLEILRVNYATIALPRNIDFFLDEATFWKIVDIVRERLNVLMLKCYFAFELESVQCSEDQLKLVPTPLLDDFSTLLIKRCFFENFNLNEYIVT